MSDRRARRRAATRRVWEPEPGELERDDGRPADAQPEQETMFGEDVGAAPPASPYVEDDGWRVRPRWRGPQTGSGR